MRRFAWPIWCRALLTLCGLGGASAVSSHAQQIARNDAGPRFLVALREGKPVETDPSKIQLLALRVTVTAKDVPLTRVLEMIGGQAGVEFVYGPDAIGSDRRVSLRAERLTLAAALTEVLFGARADVLVSGPRQITLMPRVRATPVDPGAILGRVTDAKTHEALAAVDVLVDDGRWRTVTDTAGRYRLESVDSGAHTLVVRRLGYAKQSRRIRVRPQQADTVNVVLEPVAVSLNELVTTATGQQRRRDLGNAITTIKADSVLQTAVIRNLTDLLSTRVPGLTVQHTTGAPGDPAKLRLRGLGSAFRNNDPVVIVDGVRVYAAQSDARSGNLTNALSHDLSGPASVDHLGNPIGSAGVPAPSPLDQIDPNIIEKIEVFKGPSAATLYGADAANGVIVVTTKRGKPGPTQWTANVTHGRTTQPGRYPTGYYRWGHDTLLGYPQFCSLIVNGCTQDSLVLFQALNVPSLSVLGRGQRTSLSLTASGGTPALTYSVTGSYSDETGLLKLPDFEIERFQDSFNRAAPDWMRRPHHFEQWSVTSNVTARLSPAADVTLTAGLTRGEQQRTSLENQLASLMGTYVDTLHGLYYRPGDLGVGLSPTADILRDYYVRTTASTITFTTGLNASWRPRPWFTAIGNAGLNVIPRDDQLFRPSGLISPADSGTVARGAGRSLVSTTNVQGELRKPLGHGFVFITNLGANLTTTTTSDLASSASGLVPGTSSIGGAQRITATDGKTNTSVFGWYVEPRITGERLSLSTGLRLDGGSSYGARITRTGSGGGGFLRGLLALPKLNGSWVISEEPFFPGALKGLFSSLRLRGAYGQAQVQPSPLDRLRLYGRNTNQGRLLTLTNVGNTHLKPERSTEFEGGFDADLLDSRVSVELTAYRKMQVDALMPLTLPPSVNGGGTVVTNIGNIKNTGVELTLGLTPVRLPAVSWSARLQYSRNRNLLVKLGDGVAPQPEQGLVEGYPVHARWARPILGFADANGDGTLDRDEIRVGDSLVYVGRLLPDYTTVLSTDLALFGGTIGVSASFSYDGGATQINQTSITNWVLSRALVDPAAPMSEQAAVLAYQELRLNNTELSPATDYGLMQEISTFRFQSLSVNYRAPVRVARLLRAQQLTVALQGSNLGLHSTYRGKDPDVNAWSPGESVVDVGQLPQPRTWQLAFFLSY